MMDASGKRPLVLVAGACLGGWAWQQVAARLAEAGHAVHRATLSGLGERVHLADRAIDLETHIADITNLLDYEALEDAVLVGHSYAGAVVTGAADRRPARLNAVVYLDSAPLADGMAIADVQPPPQRERQQGEVRERGEGWRWPAPDREALESGLFGSAAGLQEAHWRLLRERATPHPAATFLSPLRLKSFPPPGVRRVAIFCSAGGPSVERVRALIRDGDARAAAFADRDWELHELPTGHWPMFSAPGALAALLRQIARVPADQLATTARKSRL